VDDLYEILQFSRSAEPEVIEATYRRLSKKYHHDVNPSPQAVEWQQDLNEAYETLSDPARRLIYDQENGQERRAATPKSTFRHPVVTAPPLTRAKSLQLALHKFAMRTADWWHECRESSMDLGPSNSFWYIVCSGVTAYVAVTNLVIAVGPVAGSQLSSVNSPVTLTLGTLVWAVWLVWTRLFNRARLDRMMWPV
jgi:hypothetical protein